MHETVVFPSGQVCDTGQLGAGSVVVLASCPTQLGVHVPHFPVEESHVGVQLVTKPSGHVNLIGWHVTPAHKSAGGVVVCVAVVVDVGVVSFCAKDIAENKIGELIVDISKTEITAKIFSLCIN